MFVVESYGLAVILCVVTMLCWGSWANTQKAASQRWRFELFYWDYVLGVVAASLLFAFTLGSNGTAGRGFLADLAQASPTNIAWAMGGGVVFNAANILLVAAIALAGMSVAFPVGIGMALVLGVIINYVAEPAGNPLVLGAGVALVGVAIVLDGLAYRRLPSQTAVVRRTGLGLAVLCGVLMACFYFLVKKAMPEASQFAAMPAGKLTPYTAMVFFSLGILLSNFVFNTAIMVRPFAGTPVAMADYFRGTARDHLWGVVGGMIWAVGMMMSIVAAGQASFAISYGLGQGATLVAAFWGVFIWKEFRGARPGTSLLLALMFAGYIIGLALVVAARVT